MNLIPQITLFPAVWIRGTAVVNDIRYGQKVKTLLGYGVTPAKD